VQHLATSTRQTQHSRLASLTLLKADFEILAFFEHLWLFLKMKKTKNRFFSVFFQSERLGSGKTLSELHFHYKFFLTRVCDHVVCTEYCSDFTVALKIIRVIDKK